MPPKAGDNNVSEKIILSSGYEDKQAGDSWQ